MRILITGTPGTGKTTILRELANRGHLIFEGLELATEADATEPGISGSHGNIEGQECEDHTAVVDEDILADWIVVHLPSDGPPSGSSEPERKHVFVASHLEGLIDPAIFDGIVCLTAALATLKERLQARNYPEGKIKDNLASEAMDELMIVAEYYFGEVGENGCDRLISLDTTAQSVERCVEQIEVFVRDRE